jgi:hypothetical protein
MNVRFVRLISGSHEVLPEGSPGTHGELRSLKDRHGEKIAALEAESGALLGTVGLYPDRDEGGHFFRLTGIDVAHGHTGKGIDAALLEEARHFVSERRVSRLKFGTNPLLTGNAELYITRFGARYRWREGIRTPDGRPCPYVSCECDFDDPSARPLDLTEQEVVQRSVLSWNGLRPLPRRDVVYAGPLSVLLPEMSAEALGDAGARDPELLPALWSVFHALSIHGYDFAWFDRLDPALNPSGTPPCYYIMKSLISL